MYKRDPGFICIIGDGGNAPVLLPIKESLRLWNAKAIQGTGNYLIGLNCLCEYVFFDINLYYGLYYL